MTRLLVRATACLALIWSVIAVGSIVRPHALWDAQQVVAAALGLNS